jgi:SH3 domain-containing YSC84-like protein 1
MYILFLLFLSAMTAFAASEKTDVANRLNAAADVLNEIMAAPDKGIPRDLLDKAYCIVVVPSLKQGGFIVGAKYGKGFINCRKDHTGWSAPAAVRVEGGEVGLLIGGEATDVVLLVMNEQGAKELLSTKFTLGGEAAGAAGPVGRTTTAQTDAAMRAKILSYSRSRGIFGGVALTGATLRQDLDDNKAMYGKPLTNKEIVEGNVPPPPEAAKLMAELNKYSRIQSSK